MVRKNQVYPFSRLHHFLLSELTSEPQLLLIGATRINITYDAVSGLVAVKCIIKIRLEPRLQSFERAVMRYFKPLCRLALGSMVFLAGCSSFTPLATLASHAPLTELSVRAIPPPGAMYQPSPRYDYGTVDQRGFSRE